MLCDFIKKAQKGDKDAMLELINRFVPLFKKYAVKLYYEDAYEEMVLCFIELIHFLDLDKLNGHGDETIVSYINISIKNFYNKKVRQLIEAKKETTLSSLTEEQVYYVETLSAKADKTDFFIEFGITELLNQNEYQIVYLVYMEGYTTAEIARKLRKSRQAVNQLKQRALQKIKNTLESYPVN